MGKKIIYLKLSLNLRIFHNLFLKAEAGFNEAGQQQSL